MVRLRYSALTLLCFVVVVSLLSACSTENAGLDETTSQGSEASTVSASPSSDETATVESDDSSAWQPPVLPPRPTMDVEASQPSVADAAAALIRLADEADLLGGSCTNLPQLRAWVVTPMATGGCRVGS